MSIKMRWLGTACFEIVLPDKKTIVIDPYLDDSVSAPITSDKVEGCDYIFLTHGHYDHILDVGKLAERFNPKIFCSDVAAASLKEFQGVSPSLITEVKAGQVIHEEDLAIEVLKGVHVDFTKEYKRITGHDLPDSEKDPMTTIKKALNVVFGTDRVPDQFGDWMVQYPQGDQLNFVFEPTDGRRIYMAGSYPDTGVIEVAQQAEAYITLLQVLPGRTLRGLEQQTASLAMASGCDIVVPQHYDPLFEGSEKTDLTELKRILEEKTDIIFQELVPGRWYDFD